MMTTSSHDEKQQKQQKTNRIHFSFNIKDSKRVFFTGSEEDKKSENTHKAAACDESKM